MAERRMFAKSIIDSDLFLEMPASTQMLYFHLAMRADDDGFVNNPKRIMRMVGASEDDMKVLLAKQFILAFDSGVIVIRHWKVHNYIRNDRYKETLNTEEKVKLTIDESGAYSRVDTVGIPNGYQMDTQVRIGKDRLDKVNKERTDTNVSARKKADTNVSYESIMDESGIDESVKAVVWDFVKMRKLIKAPMTDRGLSMMLNKLIKMDGTAEGQIAILEQSIMNSWKGIFQVQKDKPKERRSSYEFDMEEYARKLDEWGIGNDTE